MLRRIFFWLHLTAGVLAGAVILVMSVTGVLLTYEKDMVAWADTRHFTVATNQVQRLTLDELVARARAGRSDRPASVTVRADPAKPTEVGFGAAGTLFLDPYTGTVLGRENQQVRAFFRSVTDWHRWLARPQSNRTIGRAITGASNLVFFFILLSGLYLWIPKVWNRVQFRNVTLFRRGLSPRARDFNWHNVVGLWSSIPLVIIVASGAVISYPWASDLVYRVAGEAPPVRRPAVAPVLAGAAPASAPRQEPFTESIEAIVQTAKIQRPDWTSITIRIAAAANGSVSVSIDAGRGGQPQKRGTLAVDAATGNPLKYEDFASMSPGRRARSWMRFAHTGEVYGWLGQTVAGLASLAGVVLVWTGMAMALRRLLARLRRRGAAETLRRAA